MDILEKAKSIKRASGTKKKVTDEEIVIAIAWMKGEITMFQAAKALEKGSSIFQARCGVVLREAYRQGKIKVV